MFIDRRRTKASHSARSAILVLLFGTYHMDMALLAECECFLSCAINMDPLRG